MGRAACHRAGVLRDTPVLPGATLLSKGARPLPRGAFSDACVRGSEGCAHRMGRRIAPDQHASGTHAFVVQGCGARACSAHGEAVQRRLHDTSLGIAHAHVQAGPS
eukprot:13115725-Heterocapsa_arctica.AAC.1